MQTKTKILIAHYAGSFTDGHEDIEVLAVFDGMPDEDVLYDTILTKVVPNTDLDDEGEEFAKFVTDIILEDEDNVYDSEYYGEFDEEMYIKLHNVGF